MGHRLGIRHDTDETDEFPVCGVLVHIDTTHDADGKTNQATSDH